MHKIFESFASFVVRRRVWVLVGLVLVTGFMLSQARNLRMVIDPNALLQFRLFPDMLPFVRQIQIATDFAKGCGARLAGVAVPPYEDSEQSFAELKARIVKTIAFLESLPQADIDGSETRAITTGSGEKTKHFTGQTYLFHYALPHFFFHATTAYDILRHNGIEVGKKDFIGSF